MAEDVNLPERLKPAMEYVLASVGTAGADSLDVGLVGQLVDFVMEPKEMKDTYTMGMRKREVSNYYEFLLERPFRETMDIIYNPDIPAYVTVPASVRLSRWIQVDGRQQPLPRIADALDHLAAPKIVNGVEFVENTPDTTTGAYYAYELDRTLILMMHRGHRVLLSLSRQRDKSTVGKKGLVLGSADDWNYLYTGEKGCTRPGLGWVDSYMYHSESITVYVESDEPDPHVKMGLFRWLHAGWAGMNMVQPANIRTGVMQFAETFKGVVEAPALESAEPLARAMRRISALPTETLRRQVEAYYALLKTRYQNAKGRSKKWFDKLFKDDRYCRQLNHEELKAILGKIFLKTLLGKERGFDLSAFADPANPADKV